MAILIYIVFLLALVGWFLSSLLDAIEIIVRGIHEGKPKEELNYAKPFIKMTVALVLIYLVFIPKY